MGSTGKTTQVILHVFNINRADTLPSGLGFCYEPQVARSRIVSSTIKPFPINRQSKKVVLKSSYKQKAKLNYVMSDSLVRILWRLDKLADKMKLDLSILPNAGLDLAVSCTTNYSPSKGSLLAYLRVTILNEIRKYLSVADIETEEYSEDIEYDDQDSGASYDFSCLASDEVELLSDWFVGRVSRAALESKYGCTRGALYYRIQKTLRKLKLNGLPVREDICNLQLLDRYYEQS